MTLNFQNKIVFPAPETSYTTQSAFGQVIYIPRDIMKQVESSKLSGGQKQPYYEKQKKTIEKEFVVVNHEDVNEEDPLAAEIRAQQKTLGKKPDAVGDDDDKNKCDADDT